jgi:hypothetical protein
MHGRRCDSIIGQTKLYYTPSCPPVRNHTNFQGCFLHSFSSPYAFANPDLQAPFTSQGEHMMLVPAVAFAAEAGGFGLTIRTQSSSLVRVTNDPKLNRGIYSIQFVCQLLIRHELIFVKIPQRPPVSGRKWIIGFQPPPFFTRLLFHNS